MGEVILDWILIGLLDALGNAISDGIDYLVRQVTDGAGRVFTEFVQQIDTDGDGVYDQEIILHSLEMLIPDMDNGYCLVSDGDTVGLGLPAYQLIDGIDLCSYIDLSDPVHYPCITGNDNGFILDMDYDGLADDVIIALPDFTGDGANEWGWILDLDSNGVPDVSPDSPYYPVGSEEYYAVVQASEDAIMSKNLDQYTVTEGLLLILAIFAIINFLKGLFRKREVF